MSDESSEVTEIRKGDKNPENLNSAETQWLFSIQEKVLHTKTPRGLQLSEKNVGSGAGWDSYGNDNLFREAKTWGSGENDMYSHKAKEVYDKGGVIVQLIPGIKVDSKVGDVVKIGFAQKADSIEDPRWRTNENGENYFPVLLDVMVPAGTGEELKKELENGTVRVRRIVENLYPGMKDRLLIYNDETLGDNLRSEASSNKLEQKEGARISPAEETMSNRERDRLGQEGAEKKDPLEYKKEVERNLIVDTFTCSNCGTENSHGLTCQNCQARRENYPPGLDEAVSGYISSRRLANSDNLRLNEDQKYQQLRTWYALYGNVDPRGLAELPQDLRDRINSVRGKINYSVLDEVAIELANVDGVPGGDPERMGTQVRNANNLPNNEGRAERGEVRDINVLRDQFLEKISQEVKFTGARLIDARRVKSILNDETDASRELKNAFEKEALALAVLVQRSVIKSEMVANPDGLYAVLNRDREKIPYGDFEQKANLFMMGHEDGYVLDLLEGQNNNPERMARINRALMIFTGIARGHDGGNPALSEYASKFRFVTNAEGKVVKEGVKSKDDEARFISLIANQFRMSEYEARIAYILFEAYVEPEFNPGHPMYRLCHPRETFDPKAMSGGWLLEDIKVGDQNGLPERLWIPTAFITRETTGGGVPLFNEMSRGRGVDALIYMLRDPKIKNETMLKSSLGDARTAAKALKQLNDIGPATQTAKFNAEMLWGLKDSLSGLEKKGYIDIKEVTRTLEAAANVYFWEMSVNSPIYAKPEDKGQRFMNPIEMMNRYLLVITKQDRERKLVGLFDFPGDNGEKIVKRLRKITLEYIKQVNNQKNLIPVDQNVNGLVGRIAAGMPDKYIQANEIKKYQAEAAKRDSFGLWGSRKFSDLR